MDLNSPEFYTIAFVVAMALVALLMGQRDKGPASTHIVQLPTTVADDDSNDEDTVRLRHVGGGKVLISREGLYLAPEETINLVFTIRDSECSILEKKGVKQRNAIGESVKGEITVKFFRPMKYHMRYESQVTSRWASFTYDASSSQEKTVSLDY